MRPTREGFDLCPQTNLVLGDSPGGEIADAVLETVLSDLIICRYKVFELQAEDNNITTHF